MSITLKQVDFTYDPGTPYETKALDQVTASIKQGEFIGLIGHTGSGKSTLIQMLNGLLKPTSGQIHINDFDLTQPKVKLSDIRKRVGLVFQYPEYQLFEETIEKDIAFGPKNLGLKGQDISQRVQYAMQAVGLDYNDLGPVSPFDLSGGQKRRVAIAGVLAMHPEVLILDEPTAGLDPKGRLEILSLIEEEHRRQGRTTILVSHSMEDVARYVDRIMVMDKGKLVLFDTPEKVFDKEEDLKAMGLDIPEVTKVIKALNQGGFNLPLNLYDMPSLAQHIASAMEVTHD